MDAILNYLRLHISIFYLILTYICAIILSLTESYLFKKIYPTLIARSKIWDESLLFSLHHPIIFLIWSISLMISYDLITSTYFTTTIIDSSLLRNSIFIIFMGWFLISFINQLENKFTEKSNEHIFNSDPTTIIALSQISRVVVISILSLVFLQSIGISISALLAFGGVGALTMGFAAKDTLANLLGGIMIFIDRPFSVADFIKSSDDQIEGTVEHIGWRLTRIRDAEMNARYVPNALFSTITIINLSRIKSRRIKATLKLRFQDLGKLNAIVDEIRYFLKSHPAINQREVIAVSFEDIGEYSLNLLILAFTKTTDWVEYLTVQQEILIDVLNIIHEHHAECAIPSIDALYHGAA